MAAALLILAIGGNWYFHCFSITLFPTTATDGNVLAALTFNCNLPLRYTDREERRENIASLIKESGAEIVFITENFTRKTDSLGIKIKELYPFQTKHSNLAGNVLYSKFPILKDSVIHDGNMGFQINFCQIDYKGIEVDVIGVHLTSNNYDDHNNRMTPDSVKSGKQLGTYLKNIKEAANCRTQEAEMIIHLIDSLAIASHPTVIMGDFNDVSGSSALNVLFNAEMQDAWWEAGFGYGATIRHPLPFRLDHILYNDRMKLQGIKKIDTQGLSDHDALLGKFEIL